MAHGIRKFGDKIRVRLQHEYKEPDTDVAVFYGLMRNVLDDYRRAGRKAIYVDLGYWGRHLGGRFAGFHKLALNARHPTAYFQKSKHHGSRFNQFNVRVRRWKERRGDSILLAGMSDKAAEAEGFRPEQWETEIVAKLRYYTDREIIYRPKPNWDGAKGVPGTRMVRGRDGDVETVLAQCHAVVTHHSNVAIDALLYGVPVFCWDGIATAPGKACSDLSLIENPPEALDREQWASDAAWTQWNVSEMRKGSAWKYLRDEVLEL